MSPDLSRRQFLEASAAAAVASVPIMAAGRENVMATNTSVDFLLNGERREVTVEPRVSLLASGIALADRAVRSGSKLTRP